MQVIVFPSNQTAYSTGVSTFKDLQKLVGGFITVAPQPCSIGDQEANLLVNEKGMPMNLPRNQHYPHFVGDVVIAPKGWSDLP